MVYLVVEESVNALMALQAVLLNSEADAVFLAMYAKAWAVS